MRTCRVLCGAIVCGLGVFGLLTQVGLAGPLAPPSGPVAPTFKTLQQVEPRIPISDATTPGNAAAMAVITESGSYYLTADLVTTGLRAGIRILAPNVTIDLNGMTIRCGAGATGVAGITDDGDNENAPQFITIRNGRIADFSGTNRNAVYFGGDGQLSVEQLSIANCFNGIISENGPVRASAVTAFGTSSTIGVAFSGDQSSFYTGCTVSFFGDGLRARQALVRECVFINCSVAVDAERSRVENCSISASIGGGTVGVRAGFLSTVTGCSLNNLGTGIKTSILGQLIEGNFFTACDTGVLVEGEAATVRGNTFKQITNTSATATCIRVNASGTRATIADNTGERFDFGIVVSGTGAVVTGNRFGHPILNNAAIYQLVSGTRYGPLVRSQPGTAATVSASTSSNVAGTMGSTDPTANFFW